MNRRRYMNANRMRVLDYIELKVTLGDTDINKMKPIDRASFDLTPPDMSEIKFIELDATCYGPDTSNLRVVFPNLWAGAFLMVSPAAIYMENYSGGYGDVEVRHNYEDGWNVRLIPKEAYDKTVIVPNSNKKGTHTGPAVDVKFRIQILSNNLPTNSRVKTRIWVNDSSTAQEKNQWDAYAQGGAARCDKLEIGRPIYRGDRGNVVHYLDFDQPYARIKELRCYNLNNSLLHQYVPAKLGNRGFFVDLVNPRGTHGNVMKYLCTYVENEITKEGNTYNLGPVKEVQPVF